jgi:hemerythrin-like metal-binding protein
MFEWKPQFSVGIGSIDGQHQNLFAIARELYAAMSAGQGKLAVGRVLDRLVQYTAIHFAHEERLMQQFQFPAFAKHQEEHRMLTRQVLAFQADYEAGRVAMSIQLLNFLKDWLEHHIQTEDSAYAPYVKSGATA